jgi:hypothetical protein
MATPATGRERMGLVIYFIVLYLFFDLVRPGFVGISQKS